MAIVDVGQLKDYLNVSASKDDELLGTLAADAQRIIEARTRRRFEPVTATRYYNVDCVSGALLFLDDDLLQVTGLVDGAGNTVPEAEFRLEPRNYKPHSMVRVIGARSWLFDIDGEIAVTGLWGYDQSCSNFGLAIRAITRTAAWLYRQRDTSSDQDRPIASDSGVLIMPSRLPSDIYDMIQPLRRNNR